MQSISFSSLLLYLFVGSSQLHSKYVTKSLTLQREFSKPYNRTEKAILKIQYNDEKIHKTLVTTDGTGGQDRIRVLLHLLIA